MSVESIGPPKSSLIGLSDFFDSICIGARRARFEPIAEAMLGIGRPVCILETGCMRKPSDLGPEGDGCSSLVWDYVANQTNGIFISIDINPENIEYARARLSKNAQLLCADSATLLGAIRFLEMPIDLLYLDSMDWEGGQTNRALSSLHHAAELSGAWKWIRPGGLIAIDDCFGPYEGKHALVRRFFDSIEVEPLTDDYIHVWRKPRDGNSCHLNRIVEETQETQP